jgi:radical SAM superfamily enzyme YgiQ (UPF0313 family)
MNARFVYQAAEIIKKENPNVTVVVGGHLATLCYDAVLEDCSVIDAVILGEGEEVFLKLVQSMERGEDISRLEHVVTRECREVKTPAVIDIRGIPYPARDNLELSLQKGNTIAQITASRGCCASCSFCSANCFTKKWRGRELEDVFNEIVMLYEKYKIRCFAFNDASLEDPGSLGKERLKKLGNLMLKYPVKFAFRCFFRSESFNEKDRELILFLKEAGLAQVFIGFEAANEMDLQFYGKLSIRENNVKAIKLFEEAGIAVLIGFIMLNPYSTLERLNPNYYFLKENVSYTYGNYISRIELDYNTKMYHELSKSGLLKPEYSYINPFSYIFQDKKVQAISDFLEEKSTNTNILDCDGDYTGFVQVFNNLNALYPEVAKAYVSKFNEIKANIAKELADYFYIVYIEYDLDKARGQWDEFYAKITNLYNKAKVLTVNMTVKKEFRDILYNNLF